MMSLIGKAICAWRGKHDWKRRKSPIGTPVGHVSVCDRCGITRPITARKGKQEGVK